MNGKDGLRKRGEVWYGRWVDESGVQIERRLSKDKAAARAMLAEHVRRVERIRAGLEDTSTMEQEVGPLVERFLRDSAARVRPKYAQDQAYGLRSLLERMKVQRVRDITPDAIRGAMLEMVSEGSSNRTANKYYAWLLTWARWCVRLRLIPRNPAEGVSRLPVHGRHSRRRRRRLTPEEAVELLAAAEGDPIGDVIAMILGTGMRLEEALRTTWADFQDDRIVIPALRTKTGKGRVVPIGDALSSRLRALRQRQAVERGKLPAAEERIFRNSRGAKPWTASGAYQGLRRVMADAGIEHRRKSDGTVLDWHALRHTYATFIAQTGGSPTTIQSILGHSDIRMSQAYVDESRAPSKVAVAEVERLLATVKKGKGRAKDQTGHAE